MSDLSILFGIVTMVYNNDINLKILMSHQRHLTTAFKIAPCVVLLVDVRIQQVILLKFQPAHINQTLHLTLRGHTMLNGMSQNSSMICMLRSSRMLRKMEVEEPWQGLWLPLHYQVDMGASQHMTPEFGVNPIGFLLPNSFLVGVLASDVRREGFLVDLGMAFVDDQVVGNEKCWYWLSNDIVGLMGNLAMQEWQPQHGFLPHFICPSFLIHQSTMIKFDSFQTRFDPFASEDQICIA